MKNDGDVDVKLKAIVRRMWTHIFDSFTDIYYGEPEETMWVEPIKALLLQARLEAKREVLDELAVWWNNEGVYPDDTRFVIANKINQLKSESEVDNEKEK